MPAGEVVKSPEAQVYAPKSESVPGHDLFNLLRKEKAPKLMLRGSHNCHTECIEVLHSNAISCRLISYFIRIIFLVEVYVPACIL
jgi:hypothetical protein